MNQIVIMGRLTADPELKETTSGKSVTSFSVAVQRDYANEQKEREVDFIPVVAWRSTAEFVCRYFAKGQMIALTGRLQSRKYTDKEGNNRTAYDVVADRVYFTGSKQDDKPTQAQPNAAPQTATQAQPSAAPQTATQATLSLARTPDEINLEDFEEIGESELPF